MAFDVTRCGWMKDTMVAFTYIQDSFTRTTNVSRTQLTQQLELGCSANSANYHSNKIYFFIQQKGRGRYWLPSGRMLYIVIVSTILLTAAAA